MGSFNVIGLGSSAGGLSPLKEILSRLPNKLNAAVVVVQHLPAMYESNLDRILSKYTAMPVIKVTKNAHIEPGIVYVIAEGKFMTVKNRCLTIRKRLESEKINKAIDIFFTAMANDFRERSIGVILSGAGFDGIEGAHEIERYDGLVIVQDPETAQFPLMPSALIANDHPDYILTPKDIATKIIERIQKQSSNKIQYP